jgi:Protein of unknown function, DUF481
MEMRSNNDVNSARHSLLAGFCLACFTFGIGVSQADPTNRWESVLAVGATVARGNSENFLATVSINTKRKWPRNEALLGITAGYGETTALPSDDTTKTDQNARGFAQGNHLFTDRFYGGLRQDALYDEIAGINYRFTTSPLAGYYLLKKPNLTLAPEAGPSFVAEQLQGEASRRYWGFRAGDRFEYKFSGNRARIWQTASWVSQFDDVNNWVLTFQAGIGASITKTVELRLVADDQYGNEPAPGRKNNDFKLTAQIGYKF